MHDFLGNKKNEFKTIKLLNMKKFISSLKRWNSFFFEMKLKRGENGSKPLLNIKRRGTLISSSDSKTIYLKKNSGADRSYWCWYLWIVTDYEIFRRQNEYFFKHCENIGIKYVCIYKRLLNMIKHLWWAKWFISCANLHPTCLFYENVPKKRHIDQ